LPVTEAALRSVAPIPLTLTVGLPTGITVTGSDAGDGWRCTPAGSSVTCSRPPLAAGQTTTVRLPVAVGAQVSGFQTVATEITGGGRAARASFRIAVAPPGMTVGYAAAGAHGRFALAGNTLLSCLPRPYCLADADNQDRTMLPYLPLPGDPAPPAGVLPGSAASGARLALTGGGHVAWAGLYWSGSGLLAAPAVTLHGPAGGWKLLTGKPGHQAYADVTELVRAGGAGTWWLSAPAATLPAGTGQWAGWSLVVLVDDASAPAADLAAYVGGPMALQKSTSFAFHLGGAPTQLGTVIWDGDRYLEGDALTVGGHTYRNYAASRSASAVECPSYGTCDWNTLGVDVSTRPVTGSDDRVAVSTGDDPLWVGVITAVTKTG
jgi:hypothetical protein